MSLLLVGVGYLVLLVGALAFNHGASREPVEAAATATPEPVAVRPAHSR